MSERLEKFEEILKQYDPELYMYFSPKRETKLGEIDPRELLGTVTKWSNLSVQGLVCGILGCSAEPKNKCPICGCHYCLPHIKWHFHSVGHTGILEKDSEEMPHN